MQEFGESPLIAAAAEGHLETCQLLLQQGAKVNYQNKVS